MGCATRSYDM